MVRKHGSLTHDEEINDAAWEAARGAVVGAAKVSSSSVFALPWSYVSRNLYADLMFSSGEQWGLFSAVAAGAGYAFSPLYRGLTFQFKVYVLPV